MKKLIGTMVIASFFSSGVALATTGFFKGERRDGMSKVCYYDVLGQTYMLNMAVTDTCPLTYNF